MIAAHDRLPGTIRRRLAAFAADYVVLALWIALISAVFAALPRPFVESLFRTPATSQKTVIVILTLPVLLYFALLERAPRGATIGKRWLGLEVIGAHGHGIGLGRSLLRSGVKLSPWELAHTCLWHVEGWPGNPASPTGGPLVGLVLVWILLAASLLLALTDARRRALHDRLSGTRVVRRPRTGD